MTQEREKLTCALESYRSQKSNSHAEKYDTKESCHANDKVKLVHLEKAVSFFKLNEPNHGNDDDC
ncbi:hypothetical protein C4D60_Mb03t21480 [Musa balbisiana]|uniref:Uncharacterized protein n=1 Tax=Musa balbisiana TaxID=52838 RepID=A0A4S8JDB0_MUSBA|nr:hypothetical protein C4D60_Mb03t21480 [Musa balbisiana]